MSIWTVIVAGGIVTFLTRLSFIGLEGRYAVPPWFRAMLPFVPIATLTAMVAPDLLHPGGTWQVSLSNPRLVAGAVAIVVAAVWRNALLTLAAGLSVFCLEIWLA